MLHDLLIVYIYLNMLLAKNLLLGTEAARSESELETSAEIELELSKLNFSITLLSASKEYFIARKFPTIAKPRAIPKKLNALLIGKEYLIEYDLVSTPVRCSTKAVFSIRFIR